MNKVFSMLIMLILSLTSNCLLATGFTDAADFGFLPTETGINNTKALQAAVDKGGTIIISKVGTYKLAGTVFIGDSTSLVFGNGTIVQKSNEQGSFTHVFINKGALGRTYNYHISIIGLTLSVNGVDKYMGDIFGLRGHLAFFYVKDLKIDHFRCTDLAKAQFCIHICTFEDLIINDIIIKGRKDGIHLGKGSRFRISNCIFQTADDAIALAAGGWVSGNPEAGLIEDGLIENCYDMNCDTIVGTFAKIGAAAWVDWKEGMDLMHGDAVVSEGRIYRVLANNDGKTYKSLTKPTFDTRTKTLDGINWLLYQIDTIHLAVTKNVVFRDIFCKSSRAPFQFICYDNDYCHSYRKGAPIPVQSNISLENIQIQNNNQKALVIISSPIDFFTIKNSTLQFSPIVFNQSKDFDVYPKTTINMVNCTFTNPGKTPVVINYSPQKEIYLKMSGSLEAGDGFSANVSPGPGKIYVESDVKGLQKK